MEDFLRSLHVPSIDQGIGDTVETDVFALEIISVIRSVQGRSLQEYIVVERVKFAYSCKVRMFTGSLHREQSLRIQHSDSWYLV